MNVFLSPFVAYKGGSEWGYLENTKHLNFWLCNTEQLNFRHFNINSKKFSVTVNFIQKETKTALKRAMLFCSIYQEVFGHFPTIPDLFGRFTKISEDSRRFPKTTEDIQRLPKVDVDYSSSPRNSLGCFLTAATLDSFERSKVTLLLCLSKPEFSPLL